MNVIETGLILFEQQGIRKAENKIDHEQHFSIQDVLQVLTGSSDVKRYVKNLKTRDPELGRNWGSFCTLVDMVAKDGRIRKIQAAKLTPNRRAP